MGCEGPFFKVKHFLGSLAQPLHTACDVPGVGLRQLHREAVVHANLHDAFGSHWPPMPTETYLVASLWDAEPAVGQAWAPEAGNSGLTQPSEVSILTPCPFYR